MVAKTKLDTGTTTPDNNENKAGREEQLGRVGWEDDQSRHLTPTLMAAKLKTSNKDNNNYEKA